MTALATYDVPDRSLAPEDAWCADATHAYGRFGCVALRHVYAPASIEAIREQLLIGFVDDGSDRQRAGALRVGHRRYMLSPALDGPLHDPAMYANQALLAVLHRLLGEQLILGSIGAVLALPGALDQHTHLDHPPLTSDGSAWAGPAYAITVIIPLVPLGAPATNGTTQVWPGSHLLPTKQQLDLRDTSTAVEFSGELGDCLLVDYRLVHRGTANRSPNSRPVLYLVYYRHWFRDRVNYRKLPRIAMSEEAAERLPARWRGLFDL
jgi:hypothetical protein